MKIEGTAHTVLWFCSIPLVFSWWFFLPATISVASKSKELSRAMRIWPIVIDVAITACQFVVIIPLAQ